MKQSQERNQNENKKSQKISKNLKPLNLLLKETPHKAQKISNNLKKKSKTHEKQMKTCLADAENMFHSVL